MIHIFVGVFLVATLTVRQDSKLRGGCEATDEVVAEVAGGTPVEIRFAITGGAENCYKVAANVNGKEVTGYVYGSSLAGLDSFEKELNQAPALQPVPEPKPTVEGKSGEAPAVTGKVYGRFLMKRKAGEVDPAIAAAVAQRLEADYARASSQLGCRGTGPIVTWLESPEDVRGAGPSSWNEAHYDGAIRVPLPATAAVPAGDARIYLREAVHACLGAIGRLPAWFHEGMAQRISGDSVGQSARIELKKALHNEKVPELNQLTGRFANRNSHTLAVANTYSLLGVEMFFQKHQAQGIQNVLRSQRKFSDAESEIGELLQADLE